MLASRWLQRSSMLLCAALVMATSARADTFTVADQAEFEAAVAIASGAGRNDTIDVNAVNISSGPALMLPATAASIVINFNGSSSGPTVYNPTLDVGYGTTGQLGLGAGTTVNFNTVNGIASLRVGVYDGVNAGQGTVDMTGGTINGIFAGPSNYFSLNVGRGSADSQGTFNQSGGSIFLNGGALNVGADGGTGVYNMSGAALLDVGVGTVYIGTGTGGDGTLHIGGDAQFLLNESNVFGQIYIGINGGTGTVIQDGAGSRVVLNTQSGVHFGSNGGFGSYQLSAGQLILDGLGSGTAIPGLDLGASVGGTGIFTQTGGTVTLNTGQIRFGVGTGRYDLEGGTLQVNVADPFSFDAGGQHAFNLGGGTIAGLVTFSTTMDFNLVGATTSTIDTAAGTSATMSGVIAGNGALAKAGDGTLILDAANTYTGGTQISDGTLQLGASGSLASTGALQIDTLGTFDLNGQDQTVASLSGDGTVLVGTGAFTAGGNNASTAFSGTVSMTNQGYQSPYGTFTKVGTGTLTIDGATFELGETYIQQGKMAQTSGDTSVSYLAVGDGQTSGTPHVGGLDVTGGTITFGTALQVGSFGGEGTVNQTGGTVQVIPECGNLANCSAMHIGSQGGTGVYNISGGQLNLTGRLNTLGRSTGTNPGSTGTLNISGTGVVDVAPIGADPSRLIIGFGNSNAAQEQSQGTINQTGGTLRIHDGSTLNIGGQNTSTGVYNLYGGTLEVAGAGLVAGYQNANPNYEFNLGGGTIKVIEAALTTTVDATLVTGTTSTIDTNDLGGTWGGVLSGAGALAKAGDGTLVLNAANTYTGGTWISDGTLQLGALGSLASTGAVQVDSGATFDLNDRVQTIGAFSGAGIVDLGSGALTTSSASNTTFSGSIGGSGSFTKAGSGMLFLTGDSDYTGPTSVNGGSLMVNGSLDSVVTVASGILGGTGTVGGLIVESGGTAAPGNSIGTLNVAGSVTFEPGSTYQVEVNAAGASDLIAATGTATINGGLVQVLAQGGAYSPLMTYTILTAAAGRSGEFDGVTSNLVFLQPTLFYDANNVYLQFARNSIDFVDVAQTGNQRAVAGALDQFPADAALLPFLLGQDVQGARQAFDALSGEVHVSAASALVMNSFYVREAIFSRLIQAYYSGAGGEPAALGATGPTTVALLDRGSRMSLGAGLGGLGISNDVPTQGYGLAFWTRGFGAWGDLDGNGNAAGLDRTLGGFVSGVDAGLGGGWRGGLATGYMHSDLGVGARASSADIDSYVLAGYAGGGAGPFAIRSGGAWTWNNLDTRRNVFFPGFFESESASYDAGTGQLFAEIAYPVVYAASAWEPFVGLSYVHVGTDGFTESGAVAGLTSDGADQNVGVSLLGVRAGTTLPVYGMMVTPHGSLAWQYAFGDVTPTQAFAFASTGIGFGIAGVPIARSSALIEAGLDLAIGSEAFVGVNYTGQIAGDLNDNSVQGRFNWRF